MTYCAWSLKHTQYLATMKIMERNTNIPWLPQVIAYRGCPRCRIRIGRRQGCPRCVLVFGADFLGELMLEPLGHIGWGLRGRKVIDFPGLVEPKVSAIVQRSGVWSYGELMQQLEPRYVSLRPSERDAILRETPEVLATYEHVAVFQASRSHPAYLRECADCEYHLYRRIEGPQPYAAANP